MNTEGHIIPYYYHVIEDATSVFIAQIITQIRNRELRRLIEKIEK